MDLKAIRKCIAGGQSLEESSPRNVTYGIAAIDAETHRLTNRCCVNTHGQMLRARVNMSLLAAPPAQVAPAGAVSQRMGRVHSELAPMVLRRRLDINKTNFCIFRRGLRVRVTVPSSLCHLSEPTLQYSRNRFREFWA